MKYTIQFYPYNLRHINYTGCIHTHTPRNTNNIDLHEWNLKWKINADPELWELKHIIYYWLLNGEKLLIENLTQQFTVFLYLKIMKLLYWWCYIITTFNFNITVFEGFFRWPLLVMQSKIYAKYYQQGNWNDTFLIRTTTNIPQ